MLALLSLALLLLAPRGHCDDTVVATVGRHTMGRIAELLAGSECRRLQEELNSAEDLEELGVLEEPAAVPERGTPEKATPERGTPEKATPEQGTPERGTPEKVTPEWDTPEKATPERGTPEKATLEWDTPEEATPGRHPRATRGCSEALRHWLVTAGQATTWDRLVRALRQIGRADIARELGKNLNQDRSLELRRNVEGFGSSVRHLSSAQLRPRERRARLPGELRFERHRPPRYSRALLGWLRPVVLGVLGAFVSSVLLTGTLMYWCHWRRLLVA